MLTKPIPYQRGKKKCVWTCVDQTHPMPANTQNVLWDENYLNMYWPISFQRAHKMLDNMLIPNQVGDKMLLSMCWTFPSHSWDDTNRNSTSVDQNHPMPTSTKMHLNLCWPNPSKQLMTLNAPQPVIKKPVYCHRAHKIYLTMCWTKPPPCQRGHKMHLKQCINQIPCNPAKI